MHNHHKKHSLDTATKIEIQNEVSAPPAAEDRIRIRAYELFEQRNCEPGHAEDDWFRAEAEIRGTVSERDTDRGRRHARS